MNFSRKSDVRMHKASLIIDQDENDWPAVNNLSYQINLVHRLLDRQTKKFLSDAIGLSSAERSILGFLGWHSPSKIVEIADRIAMFKSQVSQAMKPLEKKRLVERIGDPNDNRSPYFRVTAKGLKLQKKISAWTRERQRNLSAQLTVQQQKQTLEALQILARHLNQMPG